MIRDAFDLIFCPVYLAESMIVASDESLVKQMDDVTGASSRDHVT